MSHIPASVSVVGSFGIDFQSGIVAATISSLVSVSITAGGEEVLFALKNESFLGKYLLESPLCSISVLNDQQRDVADFYGSRSSAIQSPDERSETYWNRSMGFPYIDEASVVFLCEIREKITRLYSTVYFAKVNQFFTDESQKPLVYVNRKFNSINFLPE